MSATDGPGSDEERAERVIRLIVQSLSLLYSLYVIWFLIPEHQKRLILMRLSQAIQKHARSAACRSARPAMQAELRSGVPNYALPYALSLLAERARRFYDRMRYVE